MDYTIDQHLSNINSLEELYEKRFINDDSQMFDQINQLADFINENQIYSFFGVYNALSNQLIKLIDLINQASEPQNRIKEEYYNVFTLLDKLKELITQSFPIHIYSDIKKNNSTLNDMISKKAVYKGYLSKHQIDSIIVENTFNILIVEDASRLNSKLLESFDLIYDLNKMIDKHLESVKKIYFANIGHYDYNYLINAINEAKNKSSRSIIIGHSYTLNGINEEVIKDKAVNLSLSSQDLYYSNLVLKDVLREKTHIKTCYICLAYWSLYFDLSSVNSTNELARIDYIYYPIYDDGHHYDRKIETIKMSCEEIFEKELSLVDCYIFDVYNLYHKLSQVIFNAVGKGYFNQFVNRNQFSLIEDNRLEDLETEQKELLGKERASLHNRLVKYQGTLTENLILLEDMLKLLKSKNIEARIVNLPTTQYYNQSLDSQFKESFYKELEMLKIKYDFTLIDFNEGFDQFNENDFRDFDHLNEKGATKVARILNRI